MLRYQNPKIFMDKTKPKKKKKREKDWSEEADMWC